MWEFDRRGRGPRRESAATQYEKGTGTCVSRRVGFMFLRE